MNDRPDTAALLVDAARQLFAAHGYDGTSIRAITRLARANLGAVTYHFGSKEKLYEAVAASLVEPLREHVAEVTRHPGTPLAKLEVVIRALFEYLREHPELPRFLVQQLASSRPVPTAVQQALAANHQTVTRIIADGQRDGSIRPGDPRLMAFSIVAQPIWLTLVRRVLQAAVRLDQDDPATRARLVDSAVQFARAGLAPHSEQAP
ncbi:MAG: TetR family transcriptional regulator [Gemmatimonadales bacterium]|nr:TetR family transcriptional regulator [Gemmatimonadales bacterium]NIN50705.1 TetR family transcriptional regulator [Gemmatimonadales bacterium]NIP08169.1 TetR family transcriptional regulator [Gemmatimonadales bacterium]NIR01047.1 TetR family transcriptional regulator [Gemmatimonadales bacterium]NIS65126.1 TetR family transcriptional regulator [Gemmatimonadales bacterium]